MTAEFIAVSLAAAWGAGIILGLFARIVGGR